MSASRSRSRSPPSPQASTAYYEDTAYHNSAKAPLGYPKAKIGDPPKAPSLGWANSIDLKAVVRAARSGSTLYDEACNQLKHSGWVTYAQETKGLFVPDRRPAVTVDPQIMARKKAEKERKAKLDRERMLSQLKAVEKRERDEQYATKERIIRRGTRTGGNLHASLDEAEALLDLTERERKSAGSRTGSPSNRDRKEHIEQLHLDQARKLREEAKSASA